MSEHICLDETLREFVGDENWHGVAWLTAEEHVQFERELGIVKNEIERRKQPPTVSPVLFASEFSMLADHFNRSEINEMLLARYYQRVGSKMNDAEFALACEELYDRHMFWGEVIPFLHEHVRLQRENVKPLPSRQELLERIVAQSTTG